MPPPRAPRDQPAVWRRWGGIVLRSLHLVAVSWLAVALFGAPMTDAVDAASDGATTQRVTAASLLVVSGLLLLALELADRRIRLDELAGGIVLAKLALGAAMALRPGWAPVLFWALVLASSVASHAPREWRHWPTKL